MYFLPVSHCISSYNWYKKWSTWSLANDMMIHIGGACFAWCDAILGVI